MRVPDSDQVTLTCAYLCFFLNSNSCTDPNINLSDSRNLDPGLVTLIPPRNLCQTSILTLSDRKILPALKVVISLNIYRTSMLKCTHTHTHTHTATSASKATNTPTASIIRNLHPPSAVHQSPRLHPPLAPTLNLNPVLIIIATINLTPTNYRVLPLIPTYHREKRQRLGS